MATDTLKSPHINDIINLSNDPLNTDSLQCDIENENKTNNNNTETSEFLSPADKTTLETCKTRKRKKFLSIQRKRKNKKNRKNFKFQQQIEKTALEILKNNTKQQDKCSGGGGSSGSGGGSKRCNYAMLKFNQTHLRGRFPFISKFFLPDKRPRKDLIVPPTKFLLGGNISDPLNLNSLQNETFLNSVTPKSSPMTTPPKIEVIIPPNIHDPLHLLGPVDSLEYQKQLTSPVKKRRKTKHRNRHKKKKSGINSNNTTIEGSISVKINLSKFDTSEEICSTDESFVNKSNISEKSEGLLQISTTNLSSSYKEETIQQPILPEIDKEKDKEKACRDLKLDLSECFTRKRKNSESQSCGKAKVRRMDSMDKIVSPVIPQPGAWKRLPRPQPCGAPRSNNRNRTRTQSTSQTDDISPSEEKLIEGIINAEKNENSTITSSSSTTTTTSTINESKNKINETYNKNEDNQKIINKTSEEHTIFNNKNAKYQYGNYDRYYGYRNLNEFMDVRLKVFMRNPNLFKDKDILDLGCNAGHITIFVAKNLGAKSVTGIDIDKNLIAKSRKNLAFYVRIPPEEKQSNDNNVTKEENDEGDASNNSSSNRINEIDKKVKFINTKGNKKIRKQHGRNTNKDDINSHNKLENIKNCDEYFPVSFPKCYGQIPEIKSDEVNGSEKLKFPKNVFFKTNNYVLKDESQLKLDTQQYDLIMCLSVTKWIHLNYGDAGLKLAFKRMFNQLRPGGKLILESQNWASYKKKKKLTETIFNNFKSIEFYPNKFHEYLLGPEVGFSHSYPLGIPRHLSKGFKRPILLYIKGDFTPNNWRWSDNYNPQTPHEHRGAYVEPIILPPRSGSRSCWGNDTPFDNSGGYSSYRFTPSHFASTSQYYNPFETDSYLPSYYTETTKRQYCFASPLYSTVWSPPAGRRSTTHTPVSGSIRDAENIDDQYKQTHVYPPTGDFDLGKNSNRNTDMELDRSLQESTENELEKQLSNNDSNSTSHTTVKVLNENENLSHL